MFYPTSVHGFAEISSWSDSRKPDTWDGWIPRIESASGIWVAQWDDLGQWEL